VSDAVLMPMVYHVFYPVRGEMLLGVLEGLNTLLSFPEGLFGGAISKAMRRAGLTGETILEAHVRTGGAGT